MVMPISFLDYLDTRRVFKGYKEPKSWEAPSGTSEKQEKSADTSETSSQAAPNGTVGRTAHGQQQQPRPWNDTLESNHRTVNAG